MGSFISIGFVYNNWQMEKIVIELENLTKYLITNNGSILNIKYSKDVDGEKWIEYDHIGNILEENIFESIAMGFYGQIELNCNMFDLNNLKVTIRLQKEESGYFGFLFDISEDDLIKKNTLEELNSITEKVIDYIVDMHNIISYEYAFCDHEGEIQYSPEEFRKIDEQTYSVVILPMYENEENTFNIIKSSWHIDGLTERIEK